MKWFILFLLLSTNTFAQFCETIEPPPLPFRTQEVQTVNTAKCVNVYIETDYDVYTYFRSKAAVTTWVNGWFAQVKTLYANDGMAVNLKTLVIWDTVDPYVGTTVADYSLQFQQYSAWKTNSTSKGDIAILINLGGQGGRAFVNTLCYNTFAGLEYCATGFCSVNAGYSTYPTYSFTVECITHEMGHLIGSKHTHACVWNGNNTVIDGCYTPEGACAAGVIPVGGGTIMSYCHLTSVGINFLLGFGAQPKALMQSKINAATCLTSCSPLPVQLTSFTAKLQDNGVLFKWEAASQVNNEYFTLTIDTTHIQIQGSGNCSFPKEYSYFSNQKGILDCFLYQTDYDGIRTQIGSLQVEVPEEYVPLTWWNYFQYYYTTDARIKRNR